MDSNISMMLDEKEIKKAIREYIKSQGLFLATGVDLIIIDGKVSAIFTVK
jgi:Cytidylyltransferase C-terminal domain (DUF2432).